ncbi:MAG: AIM24 family protein [Euryarchaeota archaeon]|nr:AIM24 family protein [Euryarchaeota archaeon]MDE1835877.1 AIM24 family protein [Euryarchaeota archaeon]MDE1881384.1 AIM24 family protein [Euryarchaeota archaeon]MDE2044445.1 AIM24 family protein [Thermoplasmata archaeon]
MKFDHLGDVAPVLLLDIAEDEGAIVPIGSVRYRDPSINVDRLKLVLPRPMPGEIGNISEYFEVLEGPGTATVSTGRIGEVRVMELAPRQSLYLHSGAVLGRDARTDFRRVSVASYPLPHSVDLGYFVVAQITGPGLVAFQTQGNVLSFDIAPGERIRAPPHSVVAILPGIRMKVQVYGGPPDFPPLHYFSLVEFTGPGKVLLHSGRSLLKSGDVLAGSAE